MTRPQPRGAWATGAEEAGGSPLTSDFCLETSVPAAGWGHETQHRKVPPGTSCVFRGDFRTYQVHYNFLHQLDTSGAKGDVTTRRGHAGARVGSGCHALRYLPTTPPLGPCFSARALGRGTAWQLPAQPGCFVNS